MRQSIHSSRCPGAGVQEYKNFPQCLFDANHYHEDSVQTAKELFAKVLAGEEKVSAVLHTYDPLHKQYWWEEVCYKTVSDADGRPIKAVVVGRDITEKVEAARRAEAVGVEMQNIINAIPGGVAIYRVADQFEAIYFSDGVPALTRHTAEEYKRLEPVSLRTVYPADSGMVARKLRGACEQRAVADFDFRKQHRDGSIVWAHLQGIVIGEERDAPLLQCVFHNITRQKQTELKLLENKAISDIAMENADVSIYIYDIKTGTLYETDRSRAALRLRPIL